MEFLTYRLAQISNTAVKAADVYYMDAVGLKIRELCVLRLIHAMPGTTPTELLDKLPLDKTLLSKNLAALEHRGLIERQMNEQDNRCHCLYLSQRGQEVWLVAETIGQNLEAEMFAGLSESEWCALHDMLDRTWQAFQDWQKQRVA